jgi:hypothetical protein
MQATPSSSSRRTRIRSAINPPMTIPAVSAASTTPQALRPIVSSATAGPSTFTPPARAALRIMKPSTTTQTQVRAVNSVQPTRRSAMMLIRVLVACGAATRTPVNAMAATAKVSASTARPQPGPMAATRAPPSAAPPIMPAFMPTRMSALACWISSGGTVCGIRSATTPPNSTNSTVISDLAPTTRPRSRTEPVRSSTAKASAMGATPLPSMLTIRPAARYRNTPCRSGASTSPPSGTNRSTRSSSRAPSRSAPQYALGAGVSEPRGSGSAVTQPRVVQGTPVMTGIQWGSIRSRPEMRGSAVRRPAVRPAVPLGPPSPAGR